ncbi:MAG: T9SS type A sorting domain-containing protein [Bacteroidetes bacterium]|nr:T9SS type A sorting domain-containing protein [Bacteroidota bacterium]
MITPTAVANNKILSEFRLEQNYPNPFNPKTKITYSIVGTRHAVSLRIYDMLGREVVTLVDGVKNGGYHSVEWNAQNLPSGIYFYRLKAGSYIETKRMILLK